MTLLFPSTEFDDAVAAVCHGVANETQMQALNALLRSNSNARDEYLMRVELHARLASEPDLFSQVAYAAGGCRLPKSSMGEGPKILSLNPPVPATRSKMVRVLAVAACLVFISLGIWNFWFKRPAHVSRATSTAVAMLTRVVDARWNQTTGPLRVGSALEPGWVRLESGLAQVVFYSGARIVIEGPVELRLVSPNEAICPNGRLLVEVPPAARGFRLGTAHFNLVDLGTAFGIDATQDRTEVHVFKGKVELLPETTAKRCLNEGQAALVQGSAAPQIMVASEAGFAPLFEFEQRSMASQAFRYEQWQFASAQLNQDPSLVVHLDFENLSSTDWTLLNAAEKNHSVQEATVVGCVRAEGRWREKQALEFQSVNDRVRLVVPGDFDALTLSAWVCVNGLDRQFNSLFMSDGLAPGTIHWLIRNDGVLGLTLFGPAYGKFQILASPPVLSLAKFGMWQHVAVVIDGKARRVVHYVNGLPVSQQALKIGPPFRVGPAELGNWNARTGPDLAPSLIRNLSGSLDEFELFSRALSEAEVHELYAKGKPDL
ncbi:MAG TPA: LamG-like jellyroll fold domain-containing protein [Verrucomicrobiae bacterium]|nr:LamG-like jellyroll fold domain-containing protein [Verrucomicrobiae bacterium]